MGTEDGYNRRLPLNAELVNTGAGNTSHEHTMNHGHLTAVSWMPPYTGIVIGVKS